MSCTTEDEIFYLYKWFDYISGVVPGFPNGKQAKENKVLMLRTIAVYLYDLTVSHRIEHYSYGNMDLRKIPLRLRKAPPHKGTPLKLNRKKLTKFWDYGKYRMANLLFFAPTTVTSLIKTEYDFGKRNNVIRPLIAEFKRELRSLDKELKEKGMQYIPLDDIAASIQY
jgi:hypothetical protein